VIPLLGFRRHQLLECSALRVLIRLQVVPITVFSVSNVAYLARQLRRDAKNG
jgi:hypothetical protein